MARFFLLSSIVGIALNSHFAVAASAEEAGDDRAPNRITFEMENGRVFAAEVHPRTDNETLWLQFGTSDTTLLRPIRWGDITRCEQNGKLLEMSRIIELATSQPRAQTESNMSLRRSNSRFGEISDAERAHHALGFGYQGRR